MRQLNMVLFPLILICLVRDGFSLFSSIYSRTPYIQSLNNFNHPFYYQSQPQTQPQPQPPLINNVINPHQAVNYLNLPVLNTNYGEWPPKSNGNKSPQSKLSQPPSWTPAIVTPPAIPIPPEMQKLNNVIDRMRLEMERLGKEAKCVHTGNLEDFNQLERLRSELKMAIQNTKLLKNDLRLHEKQIMEISQGMQDKKKNPLYDQELAEEFTKMVLHLEKLVEQLTHKRLLQQNRKAPKQQE